MPERFEVVLDHARRYTSAQLYFTMYKRISYHRDIPLCSDG